MSRDDYYSILGVDKQAPDREIKRAYYNLARDLHPDRAKTPEDARINAERLAVISKAYNTLKDPTKRAEYDTTVKSGGGGASAPAPPPRPSPTAPTSGATPKPGTAPPNAGSGGSGSSAASSGGKVSAADMSAAKLMTAQKAFVKGMEHFKAGDFKKALPFMEAAVANDPESEPHYHMKLAVCLMRTKGSFTRAVTCMERAVEMDAYNVEFKLTLAELYETVGVQSKALKAYEDILKWEPENDKAKMRLKLLKSADNAQNASFLEKMFPTLFKKKD